MINVTIWEVALPLFDKSTDPQIETRTKGPLTEKITFTRKEFSNVCYAQHILQLGKLHNRVKGLTSVDSNLRLLSLIPHM